jgi:hypothetical protein
MPEAHDIHGTAFKNGSVTLLARIVGPSGENVLQANINSVQYSVYLLDDQNPDSRTATPHHDNIAIGVADVIFDALQLDALWTVDPYGYNFRHVLDVSEYPAFAVAGRRYLVEYRLTPPTGQIILVRFRINVL